MGKPKIRFKGFTDDWEQRKLDDVVEFLDTMRKPLEGAKRISGPYPYYGASGIVDYVEGYLFDEELILLSEDGANITDRNYPVCFLASGKYWVNNHAHVLRTKKENENNFICNSLERKDYTPLNTGMAMPKLNKETCKRIPLDCPSFEEQKKIGDYFRKFDHLITLHQRKCDEVKTLKKYMLQKMFPQNGMNVPEIRFSGFTDVWEQRKFPEFVSFFNGLTYTPDDVQDTGTLVLRSSNVKNGEIVDADNVYVSDKVAISENVQKGDIIVVVRNGSRALIGKHAQIKAFMPNTVIGAFMTGLRSEQSSFVNALLDTSAFEKEIAKNMGATINQITGYMFSKMEFMIPSEKEQQKIGDYFTNLDHLITLHQRKCDELRKMKKFMLQNMFPKE